VSPRSRRLAAVAIAVLFTGVAALRAAPLGPSLDFRVFHAAHNDTFDDYLVMTTVRGGETVSEVAIEPVSGRFRIDGGTSMKDVKSGRRVGFQVRVTGGAVPGDAVRIVLRGAVERAYDVPLAETR
jgi:hypothetical protein